MAGKCIIDSKLTDDSSKLARGYTYHCDRRSVIMCIPNRGIHADVIVYIFAHLHKTLRTEENLLGTY